jgi:DNA-binding transcriptional ArsR family regulator
LSKNPKSPNIALIANMSSELASLHKILKDETRRKIVLLLDEKGSLSYTDLMDTLGFLTTGLLNYHLKVLDNLIIKNETGKYILTEKGKLASRLLLEFPEGASIGFQGKPRWWRKFWIGTAFVVTLSLTVSSVAYFLGYIDLNWLYRSFVSLAGAVGISYMIAHITRDVLSKNTQLLINKIAYTMLGAWLGLLASFLGGVLILDVFIIYLGGLSADWAAWLWILSMVVFSSAGGIAGYRFGKKRGFRRPEPRFLGLSL